jgi:threonine dehydratase
MVSLEQVRDAHAAIADRVHHTPLLSSSTLGRRTGTRAFLKAECLQRTGSFKTRGALNKVHHLSPVEKARGLIAVSAGNHAQAVAFAATAANVRSTVVMPETAPRSKVEASRRYGADVVLYGTVFDAFHKAEELQREHGFTFVHPFEDEQVIAGQGTVGLEILEDLPETAAVVVPVGGGGLISGIAAAVKALRPQTLVIGVEPTGAACVTAALEAGEPVELKSVETIADGLAAPHTGAVALEHIRDLVDDIVLVTDEEIEDAMVFVLERAKLMLEPAGAAAVAALISNKLALPEGCTSVAVLSGGNVDLQRLREMLPADVTGEMSAKFGPMKA